MAQKPWTSAELRAQIDQQVGAGAFNALAVKTILRRRESGLTRQKTTAEIAAMYCHTRRVERSGALTDAI
jgi:hypothetical protein